MKQFNLETQH